MVNGYGLFAAFVSISRRTGWRDWDGYIFCGWGKVDVYTVCMINTQSLILVYLLLTRDGFDS